jgi:hypothetical protein
MATLCTQCSSSGLPILPVRYTVVPTTTTPALPGWASGDQVSSVALGSDYHYALRTLRAGYLYLFYAENARGSNQWECFSIGEDGCLTKQPSLIMAQPQAASAFQCSRMGHTNTNVHYLVIEQPEKCGATWIAFSEHKWSNETIKEYTSNSKLRDARMQTLYPAQMIGGAKHSHGNPADEASLQSVIEYSSAFDVAALPSSGVPMTLSQEDGSYTQRLLEQHSTRYPWHLRNQSNQVDATVKSMHTRAVKQDGSPGTPHVLALWDAIGITHELNGYRNDAAGRVDQYGRERVLQISALNYIDGLKIVMEEHAVKGQQTKQDDVRNHAPQIDATQERRARAAMLPEPKRSQELQICDMLDEWTQRQMPSTRGFGMRLNEANAQQEPARSVQVNKIKAEGDQWLAKRDKDAQQYLADAKQEAWPKYQARLERNGNGKGSGTLVDDFKQRYEALQKQADTLLDRRTETLVNWLEAPLFVHTLEDFHQNNISDGALFEAAIGEAMFGIGSSKSGAKKIDEWVREAKASIKTNLLWRAVALNQQAAFGELDAALTLANEHKYQRTVATVLNAEGIIAKTLKAFADTHKKAAGIVSGNLEGKTAFGVSIKTINTYGLDKGADKLLMTASDGLARAFRVRGLGDYVSEKIIQHMLSLRALVNEQDSIDLIKAQVAAETPKEGQPSLRRQTINRIRTAKTFLAADTPEIKTAQTEQLTQAWSKFKAQDSAKYTAAIKDARLALVVMLIEGINFQKLLAECYTKGDQKTYFTLAASGMSIASNLFDIASVSAKNLSGVESWSFQRLKFSGGMLSAGATAIGAYYDFEDAGTAELKGNTGIAFAYYGKFIFGGAGALLTLGSGFTYSALWVGRITGSAVAGAALKTVGITAKAIIERRIFFMAAGTWITVGTFTIQCFIWKFTPDALEDWVSLCPFGENRQANAAYKDATQQREALGKALVEVGVRE